MIIVWLIFVFAVGCCVGSFLNVVIFRLPEGRSVVHPPSHDPSTGRRLSWWENIPLVSWVVLGGKDRVTRAPISPQYPLVELVTGLMFAGLFVAYYLSPLRPGMLRLAADDPLAAFGQTWPVFLVHCVLLAALLASTVIDARLFIIPLQIPWFATAVAVLAYPIGASVPSGGHGLPLLDAAPYFVPAGHWRELGAGLGATAGLLLSLALLRFRLLPRSFDEVAEALHETQPTDALASGPTPDGPEQWLAHPHPRREVMKEVAFLALPICGALIGAWLCRDFVAPVRTEEGLLSSFHHPIHPALAALGGVLCGYFVGAGLVWGVRILGTLAFGKEAMGLGDVHLVGAIGACLGAMSATLAFFIAPFFGLLAAAVMLGASALLKERWRPIPYGPYLAGGAVVVMLFHDPIRAWLAI